MSWSSSSSPILSVPTTRSVGYNPQDFEGLGFPTIQPRKSQKNVQSNKSSYTPSVQTFAGFGKASNNLFGKHNGHQCYDLDFISDNLIKSFFFYYFTTNNYITKYIKEVLS